MSPTAESPDLARLQRWVGAGGTWRVLARHGERVTVALLRCDGGEEADRFASAAPDLLRYVRDHGDPEVVRSPVAGVDIDGVVADPTHRLHHLRHRPKRWGAFFAEARLDPPLPDGVAAVRDLLDRGIAVLYVSGRPNWLRRDTASWLRRQGLPDGPLYLRPRGDFRPAAVLKSEVYARIAGEFDLRVIIDDDTAVAARLRADGHHVRLADWFTDPASERVLAEAQEDEGRS